MATDELPNSMAVSYDLTRADWECCVGEQLRRRAGAKGPRRQALIMLLLVAVLVGAFIFFAVSPGPARWIALGCYGVGACWLIWKASRLTHVSAGRVVDAMIESGGEAALFGPETVTICASGVSSEHGHRTIVYRWPGVTSIESSADGVFISTGPTAFIRIPRRAFASEEAVDEFARTAMGWHQSVVSGQRNWINAQGVLRFWETRREGADRAKRTLIMLGADVVRFTPKASFNGTLWNQTRPAPV
jgi:hypothetical protein